VARWSRGARRRGQHWHAAGLRRRAHAARDAPVRFRRGSLRAARGGRVPPLAARTGAGAAGARRFALRAAPFSRDDDLHATTESITADLERLKRIETNKRDLEATDPETERLSREAELLADRIAGKTSAEGELVDEAIAEQPGSGPA